MAERSKAAESGISILAVVAVVFLVREASQLFIPIVLAVLISYALEPIVAWLARHRVPRAVGAGTVLALILALVGWGAYSLRDDAARALQSLPDAAERARQAVWSGDGSGPGQQVRRAAEQIAGGSSGGQTQENAGAGEGQGQASGTGAMSSWVQRGVGSVAALAGHVTVIFFLVFFLLLSGGHFGSRLLEIADSRREQRRVTAKIIADINAQIQRFLLVRLATAAIVAAATWLVLAWMDVEHAAVWGILAGVFNSIPYFGPIIVSGGLIVVGLAQTGEVRPALQMSGAALVITSLEGWLLTPPLLGKAERMHVVVVFVGVLIWTWIWGAWGTILAVPMLVVVKSIADHVDSLKPLSRLLAP